MYSLITRFFQRGLPAGIMTLLLSLSMVTGCSSGADAAALSSEMSSESSFESEIPASSESLPPETADEVSAAPSSLPETAQSSTDTATEAHTATDTSASPSDTLDPLTVHFLDIGQGDSTLITCGDHSMLIDAGDNNVGTKIQLYLTKQGITSLDYAIGTHPDADHIGGLDVILYKFDVNRTFMPDIVSDTRTYDDVIQTVRNKNYKIEHPVPGETYSLGDASFEILGPLKEYDDTNSNSICLKLTHGSNTFLFCGDAELEAESDLLSSGADLNADVLKVSHHGSDTATSQSFLQAVSPSCAVISCGDDNKYGHPHQEVLDRLNQDDITVYRTDLQGTVTVTSDGSSLNWSTEKNAPENQIFSSPASTFADSAASADDSSASSDGSASGGNPADTASSQSQTTGTAGTGNGAAPVSSGAEETQNTSDSLPQQSAQDNYQYILNANTHKFHLPGCSSVDRMAEKNKIYSSETRDAIISQGYDPCGNCNP